MAGIRLQLRHRVVMQCRDILFLMVAILAALMPSAIVAQQPGHAVPDTAAQTAMLYESNRLNHQADALISKGDYRAALPLALRALALDQQVAGLDQHTVIADMEVLGGVYDELGMREEALAIYTRALEVAERLPVSDPSKRADLLLSLAELHSAAGSIDKAMPLYQRALNIQQRTLGPSHFLTALAQRSLAGSYMQIGQYQQALPLLQEALTTMRSVLGEDNDRVIDIAVNLATLQQVAGMADTVLPLLESNLAHRQVRLGARHPDTAASLSKVALWHRRHGFLLQALKEQLQVVEINQSTLGAEHVATVTSQIDLATIYLQLEDAELARPLLASALGSGAIVSEPWRWQYAAEVLGDMYQAAKRPELAIFFYKMSVNTIQDIRASSRRLAYAAQADLLQDNAAMYRELANLLMASERLTEARQILQLLKEEQYGKLRQERSSASYVLLQPIAYSEAERPWQLQFQQLLAANQDLTLRRDRATVEQDTQMQAEAVRQHSVNRQSVLALVDALERSLPSQQQALQVREAVQQTALQVGLRSNVQQYQKLGKKVALVSYLLLGETLRITVTRPDGQVVREVKVDEDQLFAKIQTFRRLLETPEHDPLPVAQSLYALLVAPVAADLRGADTLMLWLDGALRYIPFAALHDGRGYLIERYRLSLYTPGAALAKPARTRMPARIAAFGASRSMAGFPALPGAQREIADAVIHAGLPGQFFLNQDFTSAQLAAVLNKNFSIVHIAGHFQLVTANDAESFLLLGDGSRLSMRDLRQGNFRFDRLDLLTLSACATALPLGFNSDGQDREGFGELAQQLGAKSVVATLWAINDASTGVLMQQLYRSLAEGRLDKAAALQGAQLTLLNGTRAHKGKALPTPYAHPYYWSPFILMGNWL